MDTLLFWEIVYLICALLCPFLYMMAYAWQLHAAHCGSSYIPAPPFKQHFTYGRLIVGFGLGIVPLLNAFMIFMNAWEIVGYMGRVYDNKALFKKKD